MRTHVVVIGLGIAGSSIAAALARRGYRVTAIEQFALRHERGSSHGDTRIYRRFPYEGQEYERLAARSLPLWKQWSSDAGEELLVQCGGIDAGPAGSPAVAAARSLCERHPDPKNRFARGDAINRQFPLLRIPPEWEAVYQASSGYVRPDATLRFLHGQASDAGARLLENFPATVEMTGQGARIHGPGETIDCDKVVVAAGSWLPTLLPELRLRLSVERRVMGWFKPAGGRKLAAGELPIFLLNTAGVWYGMPTPEGTLKVGNHRHFGEKIDAGQPAGEPDAADEMLLRECMNRYFNGFDERPIRMKQCIYTINEEDRFIMDWHPEQPNILIFGCCSGHGFKYGPVYGEIAAEMVEGRLPRDAEAFALKPL
jgi:sarcosine oxidase